MGRWKLSDIVGNAEVSVRNLWDRAAGMTRGFEVNHRDLPPKWAVMRVTERIKRLAYPAAGLNAAHSCHSHVTQIDCAWGPRFRSPVPSAPKLICNCLVPKSPPWQEILRCDFHRCRETGLQRMDTGHS